jgi:hypothetical protein
MDSWNLPFEKNVIIDDKIKANFVIADMAVLEVVNSGKAYFAK